MGLFSIFKKASDSTSFNKVDNVNKSDEKTESISNGDMVPFEKTGFKFNSRIFYFDKIWIMLLKGDNIERSNEVIELLNDLVSEAKTLSGIKENIHINPSDIEYCTKDLDHGRVQYYSYIECSPYTKTQKAAKYPVILHYADKFLSDYEPQKLNLGDVYFLQNGNIGKASMTFHLKDRWYQIIVESKNDHLDIKKVVKNGIYNKAKQILYQS